MKKLPVVTLGLLFFAASTLAQTEAVDYQKWQEINLLDGDIKITFPGEPGRNTIERDLSIGKVTSTELSLSFPKVTFMLSWSDFPHSAATSNDGLKGSYNLIRDHVLTGMSAKLISEREVRTDGFLGRELVFTSGTQFIKYRVFIVGRREYQLTTSRFADAENDPKISDAVDSFFDSFHFISQTANNQQKSSQ